MSYYEKELENMIELFSISIILGVITYIVLNEKKNRRNKVPFDLMSKYIKNDD